MAVSKKKRTKKTSSGLRDSSRPVHLSVVEKVLLGGGLLDSYQEVEMKTAWRGVGEIRGPVYDAEQVAFNKNAYPHLFTERRGL